MLPAITLKAKGCTALLLSLALTACTEPELQDVGPPFESASWDIVPLPSSITRAEGQAFFLSKQTPITWEADASGAAEREAQRLGAYIERGTGWRLNTGATVGKRPELNFALQPDLAARLGQEGYRIEISGEGLRLSAASASGLFYAGQSLRQMMSPAFATPEHDQNFKGSSFQPGAIEDLPRFAWRGMHLDVGRHFFSVEDIKGFLEQMAFYKFNVFHWHLTEDQGWRIEIKAFPRLTEVGSRRKSSPQAGARNQSDGVPYGGFYTQAEIREVVAFAADLKIDVMPEIELPGHSLAAISAYPELAVPEFAQGLEVGTRWGVYSNTLNPSDFTLRFYEQVFDEVLELFPFRFVHIGGDEAPKDQWEQSASVQARMQELGIQDEHALQAWFVAHFENYLAARGRRLVGWDEIQEGGLPAGATMMVWRGWNWGIEAARKGHDIIMAPNSHTYFDHYQADPAHEPEAIGGLLSLEHVYAFEPIPKELNAQEAAHVLGAQGQLWSEYFPHWEHVEYMAFPRLLALAEVLWSPAALRDWTGFQERLPQQLRHLEARGIQYRIPVPVPEVDLVFFRGATEFQPEALLRANAGLGGSWLVYSSDGSPPNLSSPRLIGSLPLEQSSTLRVARQQQRKRVGNSASIRFERLDEADGIRPSGLEPGLVRQDFVGLQATRLPDFALLLSGAGSQDNWQISPARGVPGVSLEPLPQAEAFAMRFSGWIEVDEPGVYSFELGSDDGSRLSLAGIPVVDLDGLHGHVSKTGRVQLPAGCWPLQLGYFEAGGAESLELRLSGPGAWRFLREPLR